jgi:formylglycine-generating enzyme required for sulfatase activity
VTFLNYLGPDSHLTGCDGSPCAATTDEMESSYITFDGQTYTVTNPLYANHPVTGITWWGARAYCTAIGRRLPTEAEWERAARGPQGFTYPWGFEFDAERANSSQSDLGGTVPVNSYPASASVYGVFNLAGNVQEWVFDWYAADYYTQQATNPVANPTGPRGGDEKVLRGGSWDTGPLFLRSVHRRSERTSTPSPAIGFRCVEGAPVEPPTPTPTATWTPTATSD